MREIKFRAWDGRHKKMHYGVGMLNGVLYLSQGKKLTTTKTLMQYTGLKDKHGKEIYEGDIVKIPSMGGVQEWMFEVKWSPHRACYNLEADAEMEVIGNVWENPEILNTPSS